MSAASKRIRWQPDVVLAALQGLDAGLTRAQVRRATGVPTETVRAWQSGRLPVSARRALAGLRDCQACGAAEHEYDAIPTDAYTYLLALYLGDGCLSCTHAI